MALNIVSKLMSALIFKMKQIILFIIYIFFDFTIKLKTIMRIRLRRNAGWFFLAFISGFYSNNILQFYVFRNRYKSIENKDVFDDRKYYTKDYHIEEPKYNLNPTLGSGLPEISFTEQILIQRNRCLKNVKKQHRDFLQANYSPVSRIRAFCMLTQLIMEISETLCWLIRLHPLSKTL